MAKKVAKKAAPKKAAKRAASNGKMTQSQIVTALADKCDLNKKVVKDLLEELSDLAVRETKRSGVFVIPGLGRLVRQERKARMGRNPATGQQIKIPARKVVKFRLSKAVQEEIVPSKK